MGGTLSDILHFPLEPCFQRLLALPPREILTPARREDCLNNAWAGARQDGIYGPDAEIGLCSEETLLKCEQAVSTGAPGDGEKEMRLVATWCCPHGISTQALKQPVKPTGGLGGSKRGKLEVPVDSRIFWPRMPWDGPRKWMLLGRMVSLERPHVPLMSCSLGVLLGKNKPWLNCSALYTVSSILS